MNNKARSKDAVTALFETTQPSAALQQISVNVAIAGVNLLQAPSQKNTLNKIVG